MVQEFKCYKSYAELRDLTCRILAFPATSSSIERSFSKQLRVHSKDRNKLLNTRVAKLLNVLWKQYQSNNDIKTEDNDSDSDINTDNEIYSDSDIELIDL